ncbi:MAG: SDR family NAD(P)-dependent oxidoreductase [Nitrososphaerales archaeon]
MGRQKVLVTGGAGFIGSHLVDKLVNTEFEVVVLDDFSSGFEGNLEHALKNGKARLVKGDVRNFNVVSRAAKGCKCVFHLACFIPNAFGHAISSSEASPELDMDVTIKGTLNILQCARLNNMKVLFASSGAVYGEPKSLPVKEDDQVQPVSPYGASKAAAELYCEVYKRLHGLKIVTARLFNTYGPRQKKYLMYDVLVRLRKNPRQLTIYGSGEQVRDFTFVEDMVNILMLLMEGCEGVFNLGSGEGERVKDVVRIICEEMGVDPEITYTGKSWVSDINALVADISRLKKSVGYEPNTTLSEGVKKLIAWSSEVSKTV